MGFYRYEDDLRIQRAIAERKHETFFVLVLGAIVGTILGTAGYFAILAWVTDPGLRGCAGLLGFIIAFCVVAMAMDAVNKRP